jgi:2-isopropylmalate synthase
MDWNYEGYPLENVPYFKKDTFWLSPMNFAPEAYDLSRVAKKVLIHDVTLRDGEQTPDVVFKPDERIKLAVELDNLGADRIEFGMPIASQDIRDSFVEILKMNLKSEIIAFLRAHKDDLKLAEELGVKNVFIEHCVNPYVCRHVYDLDHAQTVERIVEAFKIANGNGMKAYFMGWDASRTQIDYLRRLYSDLLEKVEIEAIVFVDTFGVMTPYGMAYAFKKLKEWFPETNFEIHNHNGFGLGVANALAAIMNGASCVHTALCGMGEREGNIAIDEIAATLEILFNIKTNIDLTKVTRISKLAERISRFKPAGTKPVTGDFHYMKIIGTAVHAEQKAFKAGLWMGAAFAPKVIGKTDFEYGLGKGSGMANIRFVLDRLGLKATEEEMKKMLQIVKDESNIIKGTISVTDFEYIARAVIDQKL